MAKIDYPTILLAALAGLVLGGGIRGPIALSVAFAIVTVVVQISRDTAAVTAALHHARNKGVIAGKGRPPVPQPR